MEFDWLGKEDRANEVSCITLLLPHMTSLRGLFVTHLYNDIKCSVSTQAELCTRNIVADRRWYHDNRNAKCLEPHAAFCQLDTAFISLQNQYIMMQRE